MLIRRRSSHALILGLFLAGLTACGDSTGPSVQAVAGAYTATRLTTTEAGSSTDQLAAGATITLTLNQNGTTSGRFTVPGEIDADLAGTWTLSGSTVSLDHSADTFLRDMDLQVQNNALVGDRTFQNGGVRVQVTLTKQ